MKNFIFISVVIFISHFTQASAAVDCDCKQELNFYYNSLKEIESYEQIKGSNEQAFDGLYADLINSISGNVTRVECFRKISQLSALIKDEHALPIMKGFPVEKGDSLTNPTTLAQLRSSNYFQELPRVSMNLDSLQTVLEPRPIDQVEGLYPLKDMTLGIVKTSDNEYISVVISSESDEWEPGMIQGYYTQLPSGNFQVTFAQLSHKQWYTVRNENFANGRFFITRLKKENLPEYYDVIDESEAKFSYKRINDDVDYIRMGSFSRMTNNVAQSKELLAQVDGKLDGDNLIFDLRNNSGGAARVSKPYRKLIKKFAKKGKVWILLNKYSASQAEITALSLKDIDNVKLVGHNTYGASSYGSNYGKVSVSPSGNFYHTITDMNVSQNLEYEEVGVPVDIELDLQMDWIEQVLKLTAMQDVDGEHAFAKA